MKEKPDEVFFINLKNGEPVEVSWYRDYLGGYDGGIDHIELRGRMTNTGYRSDFIQKKPGQQLQRDEVMMHAQQLAQKCWEENDEKHGKQTSLF